MNVVVMVLVMSHVLAWPSNSRLAGPQCAGIVARAPRSVSDPIIGSIDQPGRAAALSNLDIVVAQLDQLPEYTGHAVELVICVGGEFLASTSERDPRWKMARGNLRAWMASHATSGAGGAGGK